MNEKLQYIVDNLEIISQLFDKELIISVMDKDKVVQGFSLPKGIPPQVEVGSVFEDPSGIFDEVIATGVTKHNYLPEEVMGFPVEGNLVPVKDNGEVVGCITCSYSIEGKEKIKDIATRFQDSIQDVICGIENLFHMLTNMNKMTSDVEKDVTKAADVVNKISNNASHSNILALNASIEAARSGEAGRGFAVVATQMGKLAEDSGSSATEIKKTLSEIVTHLETIVDSIKDANDVAKSHIDSISSIRNALEQTVYIAKELESDIKL